MERRWVSLRQEPDQFWPAIQIAHAETAAGFVQHDEIGELADPGRLMRLWPDCFLVLMEGDRALARAVMVPFASPNRDAFPRHGWDGALLWAVQDVLDGILPDSACALEVNVDPALRGQGISGEAVEAMRGAAASLGFTRLIAPVRPPDKAKEPHVLMSDYAARVRDDGLPEDRWLRVHVRCGGSIAGVTEASMLVVGSRDQWDSWVPNRAIDWSTESPEVGGLVPLMFSAERQVAVYSEPNVWVVHDL